MPTMHNMSQSDFQQCGVSNLPLPSNHSNKRLHQTAMTHNNNAAVADAAAPSPQLNIHTKSSIFAIAGPLIEFSRSNRDQTAKLPLAFGFSVPADNDDYHDKKSDYDTSKQIAKSSTVEWHDRGKRAALKAETRDVSQDKCRDDCSNKKLSLLADARVRCRNKIYSDGSKVNNIRRTSETLSSSSTEIASKDKDNSTSMQPTNYKTVAVAGPLIKLTDSNRDQTAKLPLAFAFSIPIDDTRHDRNNYHTSKQTAMDATKEWYDRGKLAALDVEASDVAQYEWEDRNNHEIMESHVDADEIVDSSCTLENRVMHTNNCYGSPTVNNTSTSETPLLPSIENGSEQEESIATEETENKSSGILDVEKQHDATKLNIDKSILRFQRSAILALHEGVEAYLVSLFPGTKRTSGSTQGSRNPKKRKYQPGKENGHGKHKLSSSPSYRPRPVAMLVETSDCPPGLPVGWTAETYRRASGKSAGDTDTYWYTPQQKLKFRSKSNITRFLEILNTPGINGDETAAWNVFKKRHSS